MTSLRQVQGGAKPLRSIGISVITEECLVSLNGKEGALHTST